jgi:hypothetical protein
MPVTLPSGPQTLSALQAMQAIILAEALVGGSSPFAALSTSDATRYGVSRAVFVGQPKDFKDAYLPQCTLWIPPDLSPGLSPTGGEELLGYQGRAMGEVEVLVTAYVDLRADWYAGEQQILAIRDCLWPAVLRHERLGGSVAGVIEAWAREGRGLCYAEVAGVEYRCYELVWGFRAQWTLAGGRVI